MKKIAAITGGRDVPSRRYRIHALKPYLRRQAIELTEFCSYTSQYPPVNRVLRPAWFAAAVIERLTYLARVRRYDATILQRELISTLPTIEPLIQGPRILDVDDAIYIHRGGRSAKYVARNSVGVVCGNRHLAEWFSQWNSNISIIPTGIDSERLRPLSAHEKSTGGVLGWIGTSANLAYLEEISGAIKNALMEVPGSEFHIISDSVEKVPAVLRPITQFTRWYPGVETVALPGWDIGIMPLRDGEWERGKCSFKMLQYMAAGSAVVASPVGMNAEILADADVGYGATSGAEWTEALVTLLRDLSYARNLGANGRDLVESRYSLDVVSEKWGSVVDKWI